jgi:hypothetical protein
MKIPKTIDDFLKLIVKNYPKLNAASDYSLSIKNTSIEIITFLQKEFAQSKFTLSSDIIGPFIHDSSSTHIILKVGQITFNCVGPKNDLPPVLLLLRIIKRCLCILNIFKIEKSYTLWLLPIHYPRFFPNDRNVQPENINGGYTYMNGTTIFVYRFEECAKVFLHEILHHSIFDTHFKWNSEQINRIKSLCSIHADVVLNVNEAIIEFWAVFFETCFVSFEYALPVKMLVKKEQEWSFKQSQKMLHFQKQHFEKGEWKETTNAYCYIILKSILLLNYADFIRLQLPYSTETLCNFIIDNSSVILKEKQKNLKLKNITDSSMRMTMFGDI